MRCLYCHERIPPGVNLGNFCRSSHRIAYYQESLRRSGIPKKLVGFRPVSPFVDVPVNANTEPNEYPLSAWSLSARHLSILRARAIRPLWRYSIRAATSAAAKPKVVNIAVPATRSKHLNWCVTPLPSNARSWSIGRTVVANADQAELLAAPCAPASHIFESSTPIPRTSFGHSVEHDWRDSFRIDLAAAKTQGLRQIPEIALEVKWREHKPAERQRSVRLKSFPAPARRDYRLQVGQAPQNLGVSHRGEFQTRTVEASTAPVALKEIPLGFLASAASPRLLDFDVEATIIQLSPLTAVLSRFDLLAPRPPIREAPGAKKDVPYLRVPVAPEFSTAAGGALDLQRSGHRISPPQPDLVPSVAQVREPRLEGALGAFPFLSLPDCDTNTWSDAGSDSFLQLQSSAARPRPIKIAAAKKDVSYLRVPSASTLGDAASVSELRASSHRLVSPLPDLIPEASAASSAKHPAAYSEDAVPECDTHTWPSPGTNEPFLPLQNRSAQPPMVDLLTSRKDVSYLQVPSTSAVGETTSTSSELRISPHCRLPLQPDLIPGATPVGISAHATAYGEDAVPECDTHTWPSPGTNEPFLPLQNRSAQPPLVDSLTLRKDVSYLQVPEVPAFVQAPPEVLALNESAQKEPHIVPDLIPSAAAQHEGRAPRMTAGTSGLPDPDARGRMPIESVGRFSQIQRHLAHPPMVVRPASVKFSMPPALPEMAVPEMRGELRVEGDGRFAGMRERSMQLPSFESAGFGFGMPPVLLSPTTSGSLPEFRLHAEMQFEQEGCFSQIQRRTAQPPLFARDQILDFPQTPSIPPAIPSVRLKPGQAGMAEIDVRLRPEVRESNSQPAVKPPIESTAPELSLHVTRDAKVASFARSGPEALPAPIPNGNLGVPGSLAPERWTAEAHRERGSVETLPPRGATPLPAGFAMLPQPYDHDTTDTAEALRERIFKPITRSHFTFGDIPLSARRPTLRPVRATVALDFRYRRTKTIWDRATRWKRSKGLLRILPVSLTTTAFSMQRPA